MNAGIDVARRCAGCVCPAAAEEGAVEEMGSSPGDFEERHLQDMSSPELLRHLIAETKLLARAEVLHAKAELRDEVAAAKTTGILMGAGGVLAILGCAVLLVALALALPIREGLAALIVGVFVLVVAGLCAYLGWKRRPTKPLPHTRERLENDYRMARERLQ